jgi:signal transduction histidine kinase/DNA-binding response OmpR family regulator
VLDERMQVMGQSWSLRSILLLALLFFSVIPASLVGWGLYRSNLDTVQALAGKIVKDVAQRVRLDTEEHLSVANVVLNGLIEAQPSDGQLVRAQQMLFKPESFEQTAFSLVRMSADVPYLYLGTAKGEFVGVEAISRGGSGLTRVGIRAEGDDGRRFYSARQPGERSQALAPEGKTYEPRTRPWYTAAVNKRARVFTPVYASASKKQLLITLAQPVFDAQGGAVGVFAADLFLKQLSDRMRVMSISNRGTAVIVDDEGQLVASSTGDELFREEQGKLLRLKPSSSANPIVRAAFAQMQARLGQREEGMIERASFTGQMDSSEGRLVVVMEPFGESLGLPLTLIVAAPQSDFAGEAQAALKQALMVMTAVVLLGALLAAGLAWRLSRRFQSLTQAAELMGQGAVPPVQAGARITEVRRLSQTLHESAAEIQRSRVEIEEQKQALLEANEHLEERVAQRTLQLEESREEALQAARAKASFLATMSHEIRTPLNGVVGMTTLMADTPLNSEQEDYLHTMRVSSDQLLSVINDVLDYSKIESGKLDMESEPLGIQATMEEACDIGAARAREKGLDLLVDVGDDVPAWVRGDVTRLRQVLLNFINNAIKFTEKGQVVVTAHLREDFDAHRVVDGKPTAGALIEFRVRDSGIGIPLDRQDALFQSFTQVDASTTRKYGGTGLGLAICKRLAELMGGEVGVESVEGEGSTFWFTARMLYADAPDRSESSQLEMASFAGKLAVVVDDMPVNLQIVDKQLKRWRMNTVLFDNASQALEWLSTRDADVVVSDMHMPEMDGVMFAQALRERKPNARVVLLTSGTLPGGEQAKLFEARLLKPYRQSQFFNALARILYANAVPEAVAAPKAVALTGQTILVADDNAVNLKVAVSMLGKMGYASHTVVNGQEAALAVAASLREGGTRFAAVLMDANMPVMDGYASSRLIISSHGRKAPPIIALTASVLEEDRQRALDAGMIGFLPKPLRMDELAQGLKQWARADDALETYITQNAINNIANSSINTGASGQNELQIQSVDQVLMDWSRLEQFQEFDDDERTMTREVISLFVQDAPGRRADIVASLPMRDPALLSLRAHALKGSASNVGAEALSQACSVLEQACKTGKWPQDAAAQIASIDRLTDQTLAALKDWK